MEEELLCSLATLTVMSQNIRCASDPNGNSVAERLPRFLQLMEKYSPDLLGTQETTHEWNTLFAEHLGEEYGMVGLSRGGYELGDGTGGKWDEWNTILYKKSRFELLDEGTFWLSDTPDVPSRVETSTLDRIATWALLKDLRTGEEILFVNTHFEHTSEAARTDQAYILQEYLIEMVGEYPTYVTGDFNTSTDSVMYMAMTDLLGDAMADATENASEVDYTFHAYEAGEQYREYIDFIFYLDEERSPSTARILTETYGGFVSDHYGVFAIFPKE
jgi:endonuclease/exonuclease/phosphatase family metal-dependent hydrolase